MSSVTCGRPWCSPVSFDRHDITKILLKVAINTKTLTHNVLYTEIFILYHRGIYFCKLHFLSGNIFSIKCSFLCPNWLFTFCFDIFQKYFHGATMLNYSENHFSKNSIVMPSSSIFIKTIRCYPKHWKS